MIRENDFKNFLDNMVDYCNDKIAQSSAKGENCNYLEGYRDCLTKVRHDCFEGVYNKK